MFNCRNVSITAWKQTENLVTLAIYRKKEMYTHTWLEIHLCNSVTRCNFMSHFICTSSIAMQCSPHSLSEENLFLQLVSKEIDLAFQSCLNPALFPVVGMVTRAQKFHKRDTQQSTLPRACLHWLNPAPSTAKPRTISHNDYTKKWQ